LETKKTLPELLFLPVAKKDLKEIVDYIGDVLKAPQTAEKFLDQVESAISNLPEHPFSHRLYQPLKPITTEYRILPVKNYSIFYTVLDDVIEIHRIIYSKRNMETIMK
jgi:addiction module RelE/StbE family toxin